MTRNRYGPYREGRIHVMAERCETCIFHSGNRMHLQEGRVRGMVAHCLQHGGVIPCHHTITPGDPPPAVCRGFYDAYRDRVPGLRLAGLLGLIVEQPVDPDHP